ncbi:MAG: phosphoribosylglycinamide formyltransferase, partial [Prevotella sp.]|nr:phosphoribosylglycinamide formyltransferase [Prevotella sp.]
MKNLAIFVSGSGTNCENIIRYFANHDEISVSLVVSNRADAFALVRAER